MWWIIAPMFAASALAQDAAGPEPGTSVSVSLGGGIDYPTSQPRVALDVSFHPDQLSGWSFVGRVRGGYGFTDERPFGAVEAGFAGAIRGPQALVRLGVIGHLTVAVADHLLPLQLGEPEVGTWGKTGFYPGGMAMVELGWGRPTATRGLRASAVGLRLGLSPKVTFQPCNSDNQDEVCSTIGPGLLGGFNGRVLLHNGFFAEATIGPTLHVGIGWGFGTTRHRAAR